MPKINEKQIEEFEKTLDRFKTNVAGKLKDGSLKMADLSEAMEFIKTYNEAAGLAKEIRKNIESTEDQDLESLGTEIAKIVNEAP